METQKLNLYVLEESALCSAYLMNFLNKRFNQTLNISIFIDGESLLKKIDDKTAIVVLDLDLKQESADQLLLQIKKINAATEVIILSSNDQEEIVVDAYSKGAKSFIMKGKNELKSIHTIVYKIIYYPAEIIQRFFGLRELLSIFIIEILYIGIAVFIGLRILQ